MILSTTELRSKAHALALRADSSLVSRSTGRLRHHAHQDMRLITKVIGGLHQATSCVVPAEVWLLDHSEFIEDQALELQEELESEIARSLPSLRKTGLPRALALCEEYFKLTDNIFDEDSLIAFIEAYQEISPLTIGELWTMPIMLRISLLNRLAQITETIMDRRHVCEEVQQLVAKLEPAKLNVQTLKEALDEVGRDIPMSGPYVVYLVQQLREWSIDAATVHEWLACKLENEPEQLDRIVSYEQEWQAACQISTGNTIGSLRQLSRFDWHDAFERLSTAEQTMRQDRSDDYTRLDDASRNTLRERIERISHRLRVPENLIAQHAVQLAGERYDTTINLVEIPPREAYPAYYLLEPAGIRKLAVSLRSCSRPRSIPETRLWMRANESYFGSIGLCFAVYLFVMAGLTGLVHLQAPGIVDIPIGLAIVAIILLAFPALEWAITTTHTFIATARRPVPLLRYDFSDGVPPEAATMVVIPVIWSSADEVREIADRLELHYLANRDDNIHYGLLGDFKDSDEQDQASDEDILKTASECIERLNQTHHCKIFHLYHRNRQWNSSERRWIGWERKRGKLVEFVEMLSGRSDTSFVHRVGDESILPSIHYVISLDADTILPTGSAIRMIGAIHLPYNRPRLNTARTRVIEGYGILQPRISMGIEASLRSRFATLLSGDTGVDPYAFAASDPYQDGFGQGIFTGKGIFDVRTFGELLSQRIPENRVLSHDLLEGGFLRAGLLSDVELVDSHPAQFNLFQQRLHRWVRGDWQLLPWLYMHNRDRNGLSRAVDLTLLTRWQIIDNMRRSLMPPAMLASLLFALLAFPEATDRWLAIVLVTMYILTIRNTAQAAGWRTITSTFLQATFQLVVMPYLAVMLIQAISVTLYRLAISKKRLLEWTSSAEIERLHSGRRKLPIRSFTGGLLVSLLVAAVAAWQAMTYPMAAVTIVPVILWLLAAPIVRWLDQPMERSYASSLTAVDREELAGLARVIWTFFADYVNEETSDLPPDNVQFEPPSGVARRTSPTNIGLYMTSLLVARDFGFIEAEELLGRLERTLTSIESLERWEGHLYNWYDTSQLTPLHPKYVSTVDSGNFVAYLIAVREGLSELEAAWAERAKEAAGRIEKLIVETDFRPLYNHRAKLFSLGYHVDARQLDNVLYDLMASEARQASFIAIATGQVSVGHWQVLGRTMSRVGRGAALLSWSGTMFEYLMPWLLMRTYPNTLWDRTYRLAVQRQLEYARQRGVPMGISESGYYAYDHDMNYQYQAFGVPGLGFKRGLEHDLVVSPYATILALPYAGKDSIAALREMETYGAKGKYGYYEAIDFTTRRMPEGQKAMVIKSFMAHHQGMSLLTLANLLLPITMIDRFHRNKQVQSAELLLQEKYPNKARVIRHHAASRSHRPMETTDSLGAFREYTSPLTRTPQVNLLSNGTYSVIVTATGSGYSRYADLCVTRRREDPVLDDRGSYIYIRDVSSDDVWSPSFQPCRNVASEQYVRFALDKVVFERVDGDIRTRLDICVAGNVNGEVRRLVLTNTGDKPRVFEVTSYQEVTLASAISDHAHPAFSKLFVRTEYVADNECLAASRRPREVGGSPIWAAHALMTEAQTVGGIEFESDRARFIGRGAQLDAPRGVYARLTGTTGSVADPAFVMRRRVSIAPGEQVELYAVTAVAETKQMAVDIVRRFQSASMVEQTFQLAWNRSQIELRHLGIDADTAMLYQSMAGQIMHATQLRQEKEEAILHNVEGQSGLWAHGISGDRPHMLVHIEDSLQLPMVTKLLKGHEYLRRMGLVYDLVIVNESLGGYQQELQDALRRVADYEVNRYDGDSSGVHILNKETISRDDLTLLTATARIVMYASGPSIRSQLRLPRSRWSWPDKLVETKPRKRFSAPPIHFDTGDLLFFNGNGGFSLDGRSYRIIVKHGVQPPAPWINVMANPHFGCFVSELGTGYTWWRNSRECKLTPWSNDPVLDPPSEICYLRDEESGDIWHGAPTSVQEGDSYAVTHGRGFTSFVHENNGIGHELTLFVPREDPVKIVKLKLSNRTNETRRISVTYYAEWVLGVQRHSNAPFIVSEWEPSAQALVAHNTYQETFRDAHAFLGIYMEKPPLDVSWTVDRYEFIGRNESYASPAALRRVRLSQRTGPVYDSCGAVQAAFELEAGAEQTVYIMLGCESSHEYAVELVRKYQNAAVCDQALRDIGRFWDETLDQITVHTPSSEMDLLMNGWLLYQSLCCRMWARTAFYQAGGAYGYRDQLQDSLSMLHVLPDITRRQIVLHASHQYEEGDVQHWWHEETGRGIRTLFSDDLLWLPYAVIRYIDHTGDASILSETAPYLYSQPLGEGEHERYEETVLSGQSGTIMDHCLRAIDRSLSRFGEHALPLIGVGDWNDGMNLVGDEGRGQSVWLGWFLCIALERFSEMCEKMNESAAGELMDRKLVVDKDANVIESDWRSEIEQREWTSIAARYRQRREQLVQALHEHGWDGAWYRRAMTDEGQWLGSVESEECRIDAIAQSWAVISEAGEPDKVRMAMASFDRELVDRDLALVRLLTPAFDHTDPSPGYIQGYPPGLRENGAQYTHGALWSIVAWCKLGQGDKAFELFHMMNPITHTRTPHEVRQYVGEPYVMAADVYTGEPHRGRAGWTWYTGAAGWMYQAGLEWILGVQRKGNQLEVKPCIPRDWPEYTVKYRYGRTMYEIVVKNAASRDGEEREPFTIDLIDDGQEHRLVLGGEPVGATV